MLCRYVAADAKLRQSCGQEGVPDQQLLGSDGAQIRNQMILRKLHRYCKALWSIWNMLSHPFWRDNVIDLFVAGAQERQQKQQKFKSLGCLSASPVRSSAFRSGRPSCTRF